MFGVLKKFFLYEFDLMFLYETDVLKIFVKLVNKLNKVFLKRLKTVHMMCNSIVKETYCTRCHWTKVFEGFLSLKMLFFLVKIEQQNSRSI